MTTPTAAPAAPVAAATPAPAAPATPAAVAPAAAAPVIDSLIPADTAAPAASAAVPAAPVAPTDPNSPDAWVLAEGVQGTGKRPDWFLSDKYKNVAEQAAAYPELQKKFGSFVGAPKDGAYDNKLPEGAGVELVGDHPLLGTFTGWAKENNLSQKGYTELLGMLGQYESQHFVDAVAVKAEIGKDADTRINAIAQWGKANLDDAGFASLRAALVPSAQTAALVQVIEATIAKTRQTPMPKPGDDVPNLSAESQSAAIDKLMAEKTADGKQRYFVDPKFRAEVEAKRLKLFQNAA